MKKKILILVNNVSFFISHRLQIAIDAKKKGYDVKVAFGELDADIKNIKAKGIDCFYVPMQRGGINFLQDIKSIYAISRLFIKERPNLVHLVTIKPYLYGGIIARFTGVPCVVSAISGFGNLFFLKKNFINRVFRLFLYPFYKFAFNHFNQIVIVQNNEDAQFLIDWGVVHSNKIRLLKGSGVDLKKFKQLKEPNSKPTICFAARLLRDKGIYELIESADLLKKRLVNARFWIAGGLDKKNASSLSTKELQVLKKNKNIKIFGKIKKIENIFAKSHIICLPSYREGLPKTLQEAAAASRAVITTDVPGCRDAIIANVTGLLVPINDSKKLADALQWLIEHPQKRIIMGKNGRKLAKKEFAIEKIVKKHLEIYKELFIKVI